MNKKIAKELLRLAKELVASEENKIAQDAFNLITKEVEKLGQKRGDRDIGSILSEVKKELADKLQKQESEWARVATVDRKSI